MARERAPTGRGERQVRRVLIVEGLANLSVLLAKGAVAVATGSGAVLSDAIHSFADLANNGVALFAVRIAATPPDREHPYGHRKFETLAVFALATLLVVLAVEIAIRSIERRGQPVESQGWSLAVMLAVLAVNACLALWEGRWARRLDSDILRADARHTLSDVLTTIAVIAGWQFAARGYPWLDTLFTLGVAALILTLAYGLFRRAIPVLVDEIAVDPEEVVTAVRAVPGVRGVRRVRSQGAAGSARVEVVVRVDAQLSTAASHAIADQVEYALRGRFAGGDITVHVEPEPS